LVFRVGCDPDQEKEGISWFLRQVDVPS
jgi:hypothetical protein